MHGSNASKRKMTALTCYLDESGLEKQTVLLAGCVLSKVSHIRLDERWRRLLYRYRIDSLHMTDFVRPHGRYISMYPELKMALFTDAVTTIRSRADYTIAVDVSIPAYEKFYSQSCQREIISPYGIAFIGVTQYNVKLARDMRYPDRLSYLMDTGNPYAGQFQFGHALWSFMERQNGISFTGTLTFDNDDNESALQAADLIAWAVQRRSGEGLANEFSPLLKLFRERYTRDGVPKSPHFAYTFRPDMMALLKQESDAARGTTPEQLMELLKAATKKVR